MMQKRLPGAARERITVGEDIRGADINALIHLICHMPENLVGLELGTYRGESLVTLLQSCSNIKLLHSCDNYEPFEDLNGDGIWTEPYCEDTNFYDEISCIENNSNWIQEPFEDLNGNGIWDNIDTFSFESATISPAPFVLVPSINEVLDFSYSFPSNSRVIVRVFDLSGRFITTLVDKYYESTGIVKRETFESAWDGTNQMGQVQMPGTYLMHIEASNFQTGKTTIDTAPVVIGIKK